MAPNLATKTWRQEGNQQTMIKAKTSLIDSIDVFHFCEGKPMNLHDPLVFECFCWTQSMDMTYIREIPS